MDELECNYLGFISATEAGLNTFGAVVLTAIVVILAASLIGTIASKNRIAKELEKERETNEQKGKTK
jgi:hypothetical protein